MISFYNYRTGYRLPLSKRVLGKTINVLAISGWTLFALILISIIFGFFDNILIIIWEATE